MGWIRTVPNVCEHESREDAGVARARGFSHGSIWECPGCMGQFMLVYDKTKGWCWMELTPEEKINE